MFLNVCMFVCLHAPYVHAQNEKTKRKNKTQKQNARRQNYCIFVQLYVPYEHSIYFKN